MNPRRVELLVSVRNCDEIAAALAGGCDLLDFKEPEHGALGMVGPETLRAIKAYCTSQSVTQPLSMALGELVEWQDQPEMPCIPPAMRYLKMGLSQIQTLPDWQSCWQQVREQIESANQRHYDWIAVAYADWEQADSALGHLWQTGNRLTGTALHRGTGRDYCEGTHCRNEDCAGGINSRE